MNALILQSNILEATGWALIHSLWQIALVVILLSLLIRSGIFKKARHLHLSGILGLILILLAFTGSFLFYFDPSMVGVQATESIISHEQLMKGQMMNENFLSKLAFWIDKQVIYLAFGWVVGLLFYGVRLTGAIFYLRNLRNSAYPLTDLDTLEKFQSLLKRLNHTKPVLLRVSDKIISPLTFGIFQATIILPLAHINNLSLQETESILAHELAHVIRKDYIINLLLTLVKVFFYFHPGIWWISRLIESEREKCTDELAIRLCSNEPIEYAKTLLSVQQLQISRHNGSNPVFSNRLNSIALPFYKNKKQLLHRVENILGKNEKKTNISGFLILLISTFGLFFLFSFSEMIVPEKSAHPALAYDKKTSRPDPDNAVAMVNAGDSLQLTGELALTSENKKTTDELPGEIEIVNEITHIDLDDTSQYKSNLKKSKKKEKTKIKQKQINISKEKPDLLSNYREISWMEPFSVNEFFDSIEIEFVQHVIEFETHLHEKDRDLIDKLYHKELQKMHFLSQQHLAENELKVIVKKIKTSKTQMPELLNLEQLSVQEERIMMLKEKYLQSLPEKIKTGGLFSGEFTQRFDLSPKTIKSPIQKVVVFNEIDGDLFYKDNLIEKVHVFSGS